MVRIHPDPPVSGIRGQVTGHQPGNDGAVAQLGEHLLCKQGVVGSIPSGSTNAIITYRLRTRAASRLVLRQEGQATKSYRSLTIRKARRFEA